MRSQLSTYFCPAGRHQRKTNVNGETEQATLLPAVSVLSKPKSEPTGPKPKVFVKHSVKQPDIVDASLSVNVSDEAKTETVQSVVKKKSSRDEVPATTTHKPTNNEVSVKNPYKAEEERQGRSRGHQSKGVDTKKRIIIKRGTSHFTENLDKARKLYV